MNERNGKTTRMVVDTVVNRIVNGVYLPGQNFGTEVSLANSFRVSRTTVRRAMKYLCDKISLECYVVCGTGNSPLAMGPHAWNIVRINGYYHHVDVTWDNQYSDSAEIPNYGYLNLSDDEIAKDHTWDRRLYPACPTSPYNYFRVNDALLDSRAMLESFLYNSFQNEEEFVMFRIVRGSTLEREINGCLPDCIQRASARCKYIRATSFRYGSVPEQLTFFVRPSYEYR